MLPKANTIVAHITYENLMNTILLEQWNIRSRKKKLDIETVEAKGNQRLPSEVTYAHMQH